MPPKIKYSREEILEKAVEIIVSEGYEKLTARSLASKLGSSVRPIFTAFENMEEVKKCCFDYAFDRYHQYFKNGLGETPFRNIGKIYIRFATLEPQLYKMIFLQSQDSGISFTEYMKKMDDCYQDTVNLISTSLGINDENAQKLYEHMWIYSTGIATLCSTKQCTFSDEEIDCLLDEACLGIEKCLINKNNRC